MQKNSKCWEETLYLSCSDVVVVFFFLWGGGGGKMKLQKSERGQRWAKSQKITGCLPCAHKKLQFM